MVLQVYHLAYYPAISWNCFSHNLTFFNVNDHHIWRNIFQIGHYIKSHYQTAHSKSSFPNFDTDQLT